MTARDARPRLGIVAAVAALTLVGAVLRIAIARQSLFGDELSTYWIVSTHGFRSMLSTVWSDAEITPPLYFVASWATSRIGGAAEWLRLPSLVAGTLTIPVIYALGVRTVGRAAALTGAALAALAPFMLFFSTEARGYGVMIFFVACSSLAMLAALDERRTRWWVVYGVATAAAAYSHYTCVFALGAQLAWLLWLHPDARRPALLANAGAAVLYLPWVPGLINDLHSPTTKILAALSPLDWENIRFSLSHLPVGYPFATIGLREVPGTLALVLIALAAIVALAGAVARRAPIPALRGRTGLLVLVVLAVPVGEVLVSELGSNLWSLRNLGSAWPALALVLGAALTAGGPRTRLVAPALAVVAFALGAVTMLQGRHARPDFQAGADFVAAHARPGDVVIDATGVLSPGPLTPIDATLHVPEPILRAGSPAQRDHPYTFGDRIVPIPDAIRRAVTEARGARRVFLVRNAVPESFAIAQRSAALRARRFPADYRRERQVRWPSFLGDVVVEVWAPR